ncbi:hypothetical protein O3P69_001861 [Scylla paramamosain]|uniref:PDZ domain-containing protein n=1 Tax=Scylla paramamosain TaxID=85552 RepID=A0AAW0V125_SCYPA
MKVTVCFGSVRVVVPCGEGELLVRDLMQKATTRYKKAIAKPSHSWVTVHNLKQLDGGILDPDDRLNDVADDREQIIALYEEQPHEHQGGDGTSASSDSENPSPDIFQDVEHKFSPFTRNDIEITGEELSGAPPPLHVRRGSEPALNRLSPIPPVSAPPDPTKRWSAAPIIEDQNPALTSSTPMKTIQDGHSSYEDDNVFVVDPGERGEGSGEEKTPSSSTSSHHSTAAAFSRFTRDNNRCSVQVLSDNPIMARWADAADNVLAGSEGRRREPLGGSSSSPLHFRDSSHEDTNTILVVLSNDRGPLGIHVIPSTDGRGHDQGLLVEGVEPAGRIARDGRIQVHDRIIEINGRSLNNVTFQKAQEIFKDAMQTPELRLQVVKGRGSNHQRQGSCTELVEGEERTVGGAKVASVTATRKVGSMSLSSRTQAVILQSNTRKLGRRVTVNLTKGPHGLGFSITTRDNPAGGEAPIYIKNILPKGAAIEDGTLRIGDRLLEVNGVAVTGNSQSEVAGLLRQIPIGGTATLIVSRQDQRGNEAAPVDSVADEDKSSSPQLPRQLPLEKSADDSLMFPWKQREILMFEIPVHDSERAGLGVSVKGKTSSGPNGSVDLGIFVKNVIHGGAASRDGRLLQNDQLVNINGLSLLGKPNSEAMKTLRTAMHQEGPTPGMISLTVARRIDHSKERSSPSSANRSGRESANSLLTNSSGTETLGGAKSAPTTPTPDHLGSTDASDATTTFHSNKNDDRLPTEREFVNDTFDVRNPVIQRLTNNNGALRNESYYKATHDTWNTSQLQQLVMRVDRESLAPAVGGTSTLGSPTVNLPSRDTLIIHDDTGTHLSGQMSGHDGPGASAGSFSDHPSQSDDAYTSQTSLEENVAGFSRDQFGRQSMSEKRHATLDAKNTDTYQRNKKAREEREKQKQIMLAQEKLAATQGLGAAGMADALRSRLDFGPGLGMKKSSSLESLQTMVQEMTMEEEGHRMGSGRVPRGRGCNESFRAAVDRSYDVPLNGLRSKMETLAEEESESSGSGFGRGNSRQSSVNSAAEDKHKKIGKKKAGLLKGLGSMFRFGKHRKSVDNTNSGPGRGDGEREGRGEMDRAEVERLAAVRRLQQEEHDHMQEQYRRLIENTARTSQQQARGEDGEPSRSERMHQLRAEHQRRHAQRNRTYPTDDMEEHYESAIRQRLEPVPSEPRSEVRHVRSHSYDLYGDGASRAGEAAGRPGSRTAYADPHTYSHYVNYEQIQQHLRKNKEQERLKKLASQQYQDFRDKQTSREAREYQSQRGPRDSGREGHHRPVSNYYEYESVQAMISHAQDNSSTSLPRRHQPPPPPGPPPPAKNSEGIGSLHPGASQPHHLTMYKPNVHSSQSGRSGLPGASHGQPSSYHSQGERDSHRVEGVYSSGFRPASHYTGPHHNPPPPPPHHSTKITVPGSKV